MNIDNDWLKENVNLDDYINENIKKVLIHIGFHKTATSSIQQTLYKNMGVLKESDIYYSENRKAVNAFTLFGLFCDSPVTQYDHHLQRGYTQVQVDEFNQDNLITLLNEIKNCKQTNILFSEEHLSTIIGTKNIYNLKSFLNNLMPNAKATIICCVRNPVSYFVSDFQQQVVGNRYLIPKDGSFSEYNIEYAKYRLSGFLDVFGKDNLVVYKFEEACMNSHGPVGYFLEQILKLKKHVISNKIKYIKSNEGKSKKVLELISYCNEKIPYYKNGKVSEEREFMDTYPLLNIRGSKFNISIEAQEQAYKKLYNDIIWLKKTFRIDYTNKSFHDQQTNEVYGKEFYEDILAVYQKLTGTIKNLVLNFVCDKLNEVKDEESKKWLQILKTTLMDCIGSEEVLLISVNNNYNWFMSAQKAEDDKGIPQIYRDIAIFCELHGEMKAAKTFMGIAKENAPYGQIINSKFEEYTKELEHPNNKKIIFVK